MSGQKGAYQQTFDYSRPKWQGVFLGRHFVSGLKDLPRGIFGFFNDNGRFALLSVVGFLFLVGVKFHTIHHESKHQIEHNESLKPPAPKPAEIDFAALFNQTK